MPAVFVTATGTGIGKTLVTASLVWQLRRRGRAVRAIKPVISGFDPAAAAESDTGVLLEAMGEAVTPEAIDRISPWRFAAPRSPDQAAAMEGRAVPFAAVVDHCRAHERADGVLLIEGVGGVMVPLDAERTVLDWMAALGCPAILVAGSYLGTLSHTLTAAAVMRAAGIPLAAAVVSESAEGVPVPLEETRAALSRFLAPAQVAVLPRLSPSPRPWEVAPDLAAILGLS